MSTFWTALVNLLISLIKVPLTHVVAFLVGKRAGKKDAERRQYEEDLAAIADAEDARRNLKHDSDSVRNDPFNRDNT